MKIYFFKVNPGAKFNSDVEKAIVTLWIAFCGVIECRIVPKLSQEHLTHLSPIISVALHSTHVAIKQRTRLMWTSSFSTTFHSIPSELYETLKEVCLPPANNIDINNGDSQSQNLSPNENVPGKLSLCIFYLYVLNIFFLYSVR